MKPLHISLKRLLALTLCLCAVCLSLLSCSKPKRIDKTSPNSGASSALPPVSNGGNGYINILSPKEVTEPYAYHNTLGDTSEWSNTSLYRRFADSPLLYDHTYYLLSHNKIFKYDLYTGSYLPACTDPGCTHNAEGCISYALPKPTSFMESKKLIFQWVDSEYIFFSVGRYLYRYNLSKASLELITTFNSNCTLYRAIGCVEEYLFIPVGVYEDSISKVVQTAYKVHRQTGDSTEVKEFRNTKGMPLGILGDKVYFMEGLQTVFSTNLDLSGKKSLLDEAKLWYCDFKGEDVLYSVMTELFPGGGYKNSSLYSYDARTGKTQLICDDRMVIYFITDKYIYYIPRFGDVFEGYNYYSLMRIDHDGKNKTEVMKITNIRPDKKESISYFAIVGDYMIAYSGLADKSCCYDLTTGAYTEFGSNKWYEPNWEYKN